MPILHIANTNFEDEIATDSPVNFPAIIESHPIYLQLQFLPLLYGNKEDLVYATAMPDEDYFDRLRNLQIESPKLARQPPKNAEIESWGASPSIEAWAQLHHLIYENPPWDIIREVNSKAFSFTNAPLLPGATLLYNWEELLTWCRQISGKKILKTCFGVSGRGHFHLKAIDDPALSELTKREWNAGRPLIAEPWVERCLDFSTQWYLERGGTYNYIGFTLCQNDIRGHYRGTVAGDSNKFPEHCLGDLSSLFAVHLEKAEILLRMMRLKGYFGHIGFDAMIYRNGEQRLLHPIVEINARKTMGWVALILRNRHFSEQTLRIFLCKRSQAQTPLLPAKITTGSGRQISFQNQLCVEFVDL